MSSRAVAHAAIRPRAHRFTAQIGVGMLLAVAVLGWVGLDLHHHHAGVLDLVQPGASGSAAAVIGQDFPGARLNPSAGNDGQMFYAMARDLPHPRQIALSLDRPRYRLQRPGYPLLAWIMHPSGGGSGLILAMLAVNLAGLVIGGSALAAWCSINGRHAGWGLLLILLPGMFISVRISCADALAVSLALAAVVLAQRSRLVAAAAVATLAVLTKETSLLILAGPAWWAWRTGGRRAAVALIGPAAIAAGALWIFLAVMFPLGRAYAEFGWPLAGLMHAARYWRQVHDWKPALTVGATVVLALVSLRTRPSPFTLSVGLLLTLTVFLSPPTLSYWTSAPRVLLPLAACAIAHLLSRRSEPLGRHADLSEPLPAPA